MVTSNRGTFLLREDLLLTALLPWPRNADLPVTRPDGDRLIRSGAAAKRSRPDGSRYERNRDHTHRESAARSYVSKRDHSIGDGSGHSGVETYRAARLPDVSQPPTSLADRLFQSGTCYASNTRLPVGTAWQIRHLPSSLAATSRRCWKEPDSTPTAQLSH